MQRERMLIASPALSDAGVLVAGSQAGSMPGTHLQKPQPSDRFRITDMSQAWFTLDLTAAMPATRIVSWDLAALLYIRGYNANNEQVSLEGVAIQIHAAMTMGGLGSPSWTQTIPAWLSDELHHWDYAHTWAWLGSGNDREEPCLKFTVLDPGATLSYLDIGRLYVAKAYQPTSDVKRDPLSGQGLGEQRRFQAFGGAILPQVMPSPRTYECLLRASGPDAEAEVRRDVLRLLRQRGNARDVLVIGRPDESQFPMDETVMGLLTDITPYALPSFGVWEGPIKIQEMI